MLNQNEFREIADARREGSVSIYMPTHRRGPDVRQDPIRLGNLLREAHERADEFGLDSGASGRTLAPVRTLLDNAHFWRHQAEGLALFAADGSLRRNRLPYAVDELVVVGERFCVRPLLPSIDTGQRFFVLGLSQNRVRLFRCSPESVRQIDLPDVPQSLAGALGHDWEQKSLQFHTGAPSRAGGSDAMFHGQGRGRDESKEEIKRFLREVHAGVSALLRAEESPLVLAAVDYVGSIYRQISDHPALVEPSIEGNPDEADPEDLRRAGLEIVAPYLSEEVDEQLHRFECSEHTPLATTEPRAVLTSARDARVEVLFVATDAALWGTFDPATGDVEIHDDRRARDEDLLDLAVASSLASGARVFGLSKEDMPGDSLMASIVRYQV
jgi:hypothetical protein